MTILSSLAIEPKQPFSWDLQLSEEGRLLLSLRGDWKSEHKLPRAAELVSRHINGAQLRGLSVRLEEFGEWDSGFMVFICGLRAVCLQRGLEFDGSALPKQFRSLLELAFAADGREPSAKCPRRESFIEELGKKGVELAREGAEIVSFIGECFAALLRLLGGKSRMRWRDFFLILEQAGPAAFPIVCLISVLVGVILAFIGASELAKFGATIYVANLVGIGMLREMGAIMAGVILAGRTGAAFAAELGAMQANEEIDALKTLGIAPVDFLVLPRLLALMVMTPFLCVLADAVGILGGAIVAFSVLGLSPLFYWQQTIESVQLADFVLGLVKSFAFGALVAVAGCLRGIQSGRNSVAVGRAATSAVVTGIVLIVLADTLFTVVAGIIGV